MSTAPLGPGPEVIESDFARLEADTKSAEAANQKERGARPTCSACETRTPFVKQISQKDIRQKKEHHHDGGRANNIETR